MDGAEPVADFPEKERRAVRVAQAQVDERIRQYVSTVARKRAPWFTAQVQEISWCTEVVFQHRVASRFGQNRTWLAGDAAHQTGPVGVQSMNAAFIEGKVLAELLGRILRNNGPLELLRGYHDEGRRRWRRLLGTDGGLQPGPRADAWLAQRRGRILPCLPGSDQDLDSLVAGLGLHWASGDLRGAKAVTVPKS